jgi:hypothetical protein
VHVCERPWCAANHLACSDACDKRLNNTILFSDCDFSSRTRLVSSQYSVVDDLRFLISWITKHFLRLFFVLVEEVGFLLALFERRNCIRDKPICGCRCFCIFGTGWSFDILSDNPLKMELVRLFLKIGWFGLSFS